VSKEGRITLIWMIAALLIFSALMAVRCSTNRRNSQNHYLSILDTGAPQVQYIRIKRFETDETLRLTHQNKNWFISYESGLWPINTRRADSLGSFIHDPVAVRPSGGTHRTDYSISFYDSAFVLLSEIFVGGTDSLGRGRYIKTSQTEPWVHAREFPSDILRLTSAWWADLEPWQGWFIHAPLVHVSGLPGNAQQIKIAENTLRSLRMLDIAPNARKADITDRIILVLGDTSMYTIGLGRSKNDWIIGDMEENRFWILSDWNRQRLLEALGRKDK